MRRAGGVRRRHEDMRTRQLLKQSFVTVAESMDEGLAVIRIMLDAAGKPADYRFLEVKPSFERNR